VLPVQVCVPQLWLAAVWAQAPPVVQRPVFPQTLLLDDAQAVSMPEETGEHVPTEPVRLQA
jgi:hypothetical protein